MRRGCYTDGKTNGTVQRVHDVIVEYKASALHSLIGKGSAGEAGGYTAPTQKAIYRRERQAAKGKCTVQRCLSILVDLDALSE